MTYPRKITTAAKDLSNLKLFSNFIFSLVFQKVCKQLGCFLVKQVHDQISLKDAFVMFGLVSMNFTKLKSLHQENKKHVLYNMFHCLRHFLYY